MLWGLNSCHNKNIPMFLRAVNWYCRRRQNSVLRNCNLSWYSTAPQNSKDVDQLPVPPVPKHRLDVKFTRSSGPGGQNVNKYRSSSFTLTFTRVNTQVEIRFSPKEADWMGEELQERFLEVHASKLTKACLLPLLLILSQENSSSWPPRKENKKPTCESAFTASTQC
jgi:hypothetical protein